MSASPHSTSPSRSPILGSPAAPSQAMTESGRFSPYVQMSAAEPIASASMYPPGPEVILFESYLQKTPPLKSLVMKWTKRWFVLSKKDMNSPSSIELSYYKDHTKKEKRQTIDLSKFVGIRPNAKVGTKEHVFAIETEERKYILKAADQNIKNIWLAKLCELCGQEQVYHITIPQQINAVQNEAILKLSCPSNVTAILPSTSKTLIDIPFEKVRRLGCLEAYGHDVIWFETCHSSLPDKFYFFTVPSGVEASQQIVKDLKASIECYTSTLLIMEDCCDMELSFISREHYGCREFSPLARNRILQSGLMQLPPCWRSMVHSQERFRRDSDSASTLMRAMSCDLGSPAVAGVSLEEWAANKGRTARKMSMSSSRGHGSLSRKPTLDQFRQNSTSSFDRSSNLDLSEGHFSDSIGSDVFEPAIPRSNSPRRLSQQNSVSSQSSSVSSHPPCSPVIMEENQNFVFEEGSPPSRRALTFTSHTAPVVPPRSVVSLRQDTSYIESVA